MFSKILSSGSYLPNKIVTNDDLSKIVDTSDEWIFLRTGIKSRRIANDSEMTSDMASKALQDALKNAKIEKNEIDGIIVATSTPDLKMPSTACLVQEKVGIKNSFCFDIQAVCSGFVYALSVANSMIQAGNAKKIAVIGSDKMSGSVDWSDRNTCVLFGDGAGCFILEKSETTGIIDSKLLANGELSSILKTNDKNFIEMNGKEVFKYATSAMENMLIEILEKNNFKSDDLSAVICHQANIRILSHVAKKLNISMDKLPTTVENHGNTSAASIPLAFDDFVSKGKIRSGDLIALLAVGAGMTAGSLLLRF